MGSVLVLGLASNWLAASLLAFTIVFYAVVYSMWLKRATPQNIVIGGAAGALPPMIGQAAVSASVGIESTVLFLIIFIWTPPHFWALALIKAGRLRQGRHPDDAERRRASIHTAPDHLLLVPCCSRWASPRSSSASADGSTA